MSTQMKDIKPFALRMPPRMREQLERAADLNKRSLNQEVIERLEGSLSGNPPVGPRVLVFTAEEPAVPHALSELETALLQVFKSMSVEKQLALLSLFK